MPGARAGTVPLDASGDVGAWCVATSAVDGSGGGFAAMAVVFGEAPMQWVGWV